MKKEPKIEEPKIIEIMINTEMIQAILLGKKIEFRNFGKPTVIIYPPKSGIFIPLEKYKKLKIAANNKELELIKYIIQDLETNF